MLGKLINPFKVEANRLSQDESGITALETAIILIAFVVVASVFAFTILSAGTYSTERGKEAVYAGLAQVRSAMELKGTVVVTSTTEGSGGTVGNVIFTVGSVAGGESINITDTTSSDNVVVISYRDDDNYLEKLDWSLDWIVRQSGDVDDLLEAGELAEITVDLGGNGVSLGPNTEFALELKPPDGATIDIQRTTPAYFNYVMELQ